MNVPPTFARRLRRHNRHALLGAVFSLAGAFAGWAVFYGIGVGLALGFLTVVQGPQVVTGESLLRMPPWLQAAFGLFAVATLVWQALDARRRPVDDRPIIGWHLAKDFLLLPARLTSGVASHLAAWLAMDRSRIDDAVRVLDYMETQGRVPLSAPGAWFPDLTSMRRCFHALQLLGWVDLHMADPEPFYLIRSDETAEVVRILIEAGLREEPLTGT